MSEEMLDNEKAEKDAFDRLFRENFKSLCALCQFRFGFDLETAKDIVHTGFVRFLDSGNSASTLQSARAYLYKIVTNICLDTVRHEKIKSVHREFVTKNLSEAEISIDENTAEYRELEKDIRVALADLPDQMREVFELSRNAGLKYHQIALRLGISVKTVETQMTRALARLRDKLAKYLKFLWPFLLIPDFLN